MSCFGSTSKNMGLVPFKASSISGLETEEKYEVLLAREPGGEILKMSCGVAGKGSTPKRLFRIKSIYHLLYGATKFATHFFIYFNLFYFENYI